MQVKQIIAGLLSIICSSTVHADYDAADLNKLFTDKRQRAQIDATRSGNFSESTNLQQTSKINVNGYVTRSGGKNVVWVNNKNTLDGSKIGDIKIQQSSIGKNKKVGVTVDGTHVHLKPGETWSEDSGISDVSN